MEPEICCERARGLERARAQRCSNIASQSLYATMSKRPCESYSALTLLTHPRRPTQLRTSSVSSGQATRRLPWVGASENNFGARRRGQCGSAIILLFPIAIYCRPNIWKASNLNCSNCWQPARWRSSNSYAASPAGRDRSATRTSAWTIPSGPL